ncbi:CYTH domain-containing protein [Evansella tamaricis]|uniref:CYTH domain-containing protein n=1 Tax=Evansella tamaricis TaxID=2069301 RepID=A0ABS6JHX6_9BACI|nr:CYTH domain-containing protein [Evansella tamaricis]MBU9713284.1 CYTH domain-containing protein [Evansella tamaricis]
MNQEVEIEFKNLLISDEYYGLLNHFNIKQNDFKVQTNYYFDTLQMELKQNKSALRIRKKNDEYTITLKEPHPEGLLETHQNCSRTEFKQAVTKGILPSGDILIQIENLLQKNTPSFVFLGELTTERAELSLPEGLLVLDKSSYFDVVDYEVEFECKERVAGELAFQNLLSEFRIPFRKTPNKIKRFFEEKNKIHKHK